MVAEISFRPANKEECRTIASLYRIASDGVADYIWSKLAKDGQDILDVGKDRYAREDSVFSYRNTTMVERDDEVLGMLVAYPMTIDPNYVEEDPVLAPYADLEEPGSHYICAMAVFADHRGHGVGKRLLQVAEQQARDHDLCKMSLLCFQQNTGAWRLYKRSGYVEKARRKIVPHPLIHHTGDAVLMVKEL
jgi:ribosomal protein S18 acetylase RimI-like enzyme